MKEDDVTLYAVEVKVKTDKAYLIIYEDEEYWIPRSQVREDQDFEAGEAVDEFTITQWIAKEKGLE